MAYYSRQLNIAPGTLRQIPIELYRSSLYIAFSRDCDDELIASWEQRPGAAAPLGRAGAHPGSIQSTHRAISPLRTYPPLLSLNVEGKT